MSPLIYSTKMEINFIAKTMTGADIDGLSTFIIKNKIPAIIVSPQYLEPVLLDRTTRGGNFKIICAVDFDTGRNFGLSKLRALPKSVFAADGFEILLTPRKSEKDSANELKVVRDFLMSMNSLAEIRWVLGLRTRKQEDLIGFLKYFKEHHADYIRTDHQLDLETSLEQHIEDINFIKQHVAAPIKVSGGVNFDLMNNLKQAARFDVTVTQARRILKQAIEAEQNDIASAVDIKERTEHNKSIRQEEHQPSELRCEDKCGCHRKGNGEN